MALFRCSGGGVDVSNMVNRFVCSNGKTNAFDGYEYRDRNGTLSCSNSGQFPSTLDFGTVGGGKITLTEAGKYLHIGVAGSTTLVNTCADYAVGDEITLMSKPASTNYFELVAKLD